MKKLSYLLFVMSLVLFSVSVQAQTSCCTKAQKEACKKICSEAAQAGIFGIFANSAENSESQKVNTSPKAKCSGTASKTAVAVKNVECNPVNCIPENCPPGCKPSDCLPANCKLKSSAKTAMAAKLEE